MSWVCFSLPTNGDHSTTLATHQGQGTTRYPPGPGHNRGPTPGTGTLAQAKATPRERQARNLIPKANLPASESFRDSLSSLPFPFTAGRTDREQDRARKLSFQPRANTRSTTSLLGTRFVPL